MNGDVLTGHYPICGVRQRCPMSPLHFVLNINDKVPTYMFTNTTCGMQAFTDHILVRCTDISHPKRVFEFFDGSRRQLELNMNIGRIEPYVSKNIAKKSLLT